MNLEQTNGSWPIYSAWIGALRRLVVRYDRSIAIYEVISFRLLHDRSTQGFEIGSIQDFGVLRRCTCWVVLQILKK